MKATDKNSLFICQITESSFKILKREAPATAKKKFVALETGVISPVADNKAIIEILDAALKRMGYGASPVIIALPCSHVSCHSLKIPSSLPEEVEDIVNLQASHYLPFSADEFIASYQILDVSKEGYSNINLIIAHRGIINRQIKIFKDLKATEINVILSSYGLCELYNYVNPQGSGPLMIVDIDLQQVELAIVFQKKLFFSRSFKLSNSPQWEELFLDEISKSVEAYLKGAWLARPSKIIVSCAEKRLTEILEVLAKQSVLPVEPLSYKNKIEFSPALLNNISNSDNSFAALIGLGLNKLPEPLSLLPVEIKEERKIIAKKRARRRIISFICAIILMWSLAIAKNLDNKAAQLARIEKELSKISAEAKPLEEIEKRFKLLGSAGPNKASPLDILHELYQAMPDKISLVNFTYEEGVNVSLRGQAGDLDSVFAFAAQLGRLAVFKNFNVKVKYATVKKAQGVVDFEVTCSKK